MADRDDDRRRMIEALMSRGIADAAVLGVMSHVPREVFVPRHRSQFAYRDPANAEERRWNISQPYTVAKMASALAPRRGDRVLLVGIGSGYVAGVIADMASEVYAVEIAGRAARLAASRLRRLGVRNAVVRHGDGSLGWREHAPFDGILVGAAAPGIPAHLLGQLVPGGRLVIPIGRLTPERQRLYRLTRLKRGGLATESLGDVQFSALVGAEGWKPHIIARADDGAPLV